MESGVDKELNVGRLYTPMWDDTMESVYFVSLAASISFSLLLPLSFSLDNEPNEGRVRGPPQPEHLCGKECCIG